MIPWNIFVAASDRMAAVVPAVRDRLVGAWAGTAPLNAIVLSADALDAEALRSVDAVVLLVDDDDAPSVVRAYLGTAEDAGVAILALAGDPRTRVVPRGRAMMGGIDDDPALVAAKLEALLHRQPEVLRLRDEVALAHRFHGGLRGEIARIHEELQLAAMVQREFLPRELPSLHGLEFATMWRPAHYVSGDIYDVTRLDDDHVGIFIADAVGHGVPAALMTMVICRSLTTKIISGSSYRLVEPSEVLGRLNEDMIRRQGRTTRFATAVYALVNCRRRTMRLAGAGHPLPILLRADGTRAELDTPGGLLGVFPEERYDQIDVSIGEDDRLLLFSDGFEQAFPEKSADDYGRRIPSQRYRDVFERLARAHAPEEMIRALAREVDDQCGSLHQADDLTIICMRAGAPAQAQARETIGQRAA